MGMLILGPNEKAAIQEALAKARSNPLPWEAVAGVVGPSDTVTLDLDEREPGVEAVRRQYPSQHLMLGTYRVSISFEHQPAGLLRHLSISSIHQGRVPGLEVVIMVLEEFGFSGWPLQRQNRVWFEEFEPGQRAFNVVELTYEN